MELEELRKRRRIEFKMPKNYTEEQLYKIFGSSSTLVFGNFFITFHGKDFREDNPTDLFNKVKEYYESYKNKP